MRAPGGARRASRGPRRAALLVACPRGRDRPPRICSAQLSLRELVAARVRGGRCSPCRPMSGRRLSRRASQEASRRSRPRLRSCAPSAGGSVTSRLLARELSNTESELPAAKSPGVGRRRSTRRSSSSSRGRDGRPSSRAASDARRCADEGRSTAAARRFAEQLAGAPAHLMEGSVGKTSTTSSNTGSSSTAVTPEASRGAASDGPTRGRRAVGRDRSSIPRGDDGGVAAAADGRRGGTRCPRRRFRARAPRHSARTAPCARRCTYPRSARRPLDAFLPGPPSSTRPQRSTRGRAGVARRAVRRVGARRRSEGGRLGSRMRLPPDDTIAPFGVPANLVVTCLCPTTLLPSSRGRTDAAGRS